MEIGSSFIIEEIKDVYHNNLDKHLEKFAQYKLHFDSARSALRFVCGAIINKSALVPNYLCHSMIQPFIEAGFSITFYKIDKNLKPVINTIDLEKKFGVFIHLGYFGEKSSMTLIEPINILKSKGTIIIEDITHSIFTKSLIHIKSDFYICSIRKWLGVPDGGILLSNNKFNQPVLPINNDLLNSYIKGSALKKNKEFILNENNHTNYFKDAEKNLDYNRNAYSISQFSLNILHKYNFDKMISIRRANASYLVQELNRLNFKTIEFDTDSTTPLFIPIFFDNIIQRELYRNSLIAMGIYTPVHWSKPAISNVSNILYDIELSIPCDQRYTIDEMKIIIAEIENLKEKALV
jgi:hypothetical protein